MFKVSLRSCAKLKTMGQFSRRECLTWWSLPKVRKTWAMLSLGKGEKVNVVEPRLPETSEVRIVCNERMGPRLKISGSKGPNAYDRDDPGVR